MYFEVCITFATPTTTILTRRFIILTRIPKYVLDERILLKPLLTDFVFIIDWRAVDSYFYHKWFDLVILDDLTRLERVCQSKVQTRHTQEEVFFLIILLPHSSINRGRSLSRQIGIPSSIKLFL